MVIPKILFYVSVNDLFNVLSTIHWNVGHSGCDKMMYKINRKYKNITQQQVIAFICCYEVCKLKKSGVKKSVVIKPMVIQNAMTVTTAAISEVFRLHNFIIFVLNH